MVFREVFLLCRIVVFEIRGALNFEIRLDARGSR